LTEFLPISSSGHLIIFPALFHWQEQPLVFDTTMHLATAFALLVFFWRDIWKITLTFFQDFQRFNVKFHKYSTEGSFALKLFVGCLPAGIIGFLFEDTFETTFRSVESVALFLMAGALLMYFADRFHKPTNSNPSYKSSFIVGIFQSLALLPGFSRSGSTISGGMITGMGREQAARFSFLLAVPIVFAAGFFKLISTDWNVVDVSYPVLLGGFMSSFLVGLLAIKVLLAYVKSHSLNLFVAYRILLFFVLMFLIN
ncbi:hypothetical protein A2619_00775, partial [candidate division WWE3 bacterium RIFOXYD1_FULL_39_9]